MYDILSREVLWRLFRLWLILLLHLPCCFSDRMTLCLNAEILHHCLNFYFYIVANLPYVVPGKAEKLHMIYFFFGIFVSFFLAVLGLRCCVQAFSSCGERGLLFVAVYGLLLVVASFVVDLGSRHVDFSSCGTWAQ